MAGYPGNPVVSGTLSLSSSTDTYATHWDILGRGGLMGIADITTRNAISLQRRNWGMVVVVYADGVSANNKSYQLCNVALGGATNTITDNSNWIEYKTAVLGITGLTQGDILVVNSTPTLARFPIGAANQLLGVNNSGTTLEYKSVDNGLIAAAGSLKIGGSLTSNTTITTTGFNFRIGTSGTTPLFSLLPTTVILSSLGVNASRSSNIQLDAGGHLSILTTDTSLTNSKGVVTDTNTIYVYYAPDNLGLGSSNLNMLQVRSTGVGIMFNGVQLFNAATNGIFIGASSPTAKLHLPAVTTSASTAPLKFTLGGTLMTTPENGAVEATNSHIYWTDSTGTRRQLDQQGGGGVLVAGSINELQTNNGSSNLGAGKIFNPSAGNITFGDGSLAGDRTLAVSSSTTNANIILVPQGTGYVGFTSGSQTAKIDTTTIVDGVSTFTDQVHRITLGNNAATGGTSSYGFGGLITVGNDGTGSTTGASLYFKAGTPGSGTNSGGNIVLQAGNGVGGGATGKVISRNTFQFGDSTTTGPYNLTTTSLGSGFQDLIVKTGAVDTYLRISRKGIGEQYPYLILGSPGTTGDDDIQRRIITTQGQVAGTAGVATAGIYIFSNGIIFSDEKVNIQSAGAVAATGTMTFLPSLSSLTISKTSDLSGIAQAGFGTSGINTGGSLFLKGGNAYNLSGNGNGGNVSLIPGLKNGTGINGNIQLITSLNSFGGGAGVTYIGIASVLPTTSISVGGVMYIKSSDNKPYWWTGTTEYPLINISTSITNSAANNELMKSDGVNAVSGKIFVPNPGSLDLGDTSISGNRTITTNSSSTNSNLIFQAKGDGLYQFENFNGRTGLQIEASHNGGTELWLQQIGISTPSGVNGMTITSMYGNSVANSGVSLTLAGGDAYSVSGNGNGGALILKGGVKRGSGTDGKVQFPQLAGLGAGYIAIDNLGNISWGAGGGGGGSYTAGNGLTLSSTVFKLGGTTNANIDIDSISAGTLSFNFGATNNFNDFGIYSNSIFASTDLFQMQSSTGDTGFIFGQDVGASIYQALIYAKYNSISAGYYTDGSSHIDGIVLATGTIGVGPVIRLFIDQSGAWSIGGTVTSHNFGTSGQVLMSNGTGAAPSWSTPSGSGWAITGTTNLTGNVVVHGSTDIEISQQVTSNWTQGLFIGTTAGLSGSLGTNLKYSENSGSRNHNIFLDQGGITLKVNSSGGIVLDTSASSGNIIRLNGFVFLDGGYTQNDNSKTRVIVMDSSTNRLYYSTSVVITGQSNTYSAGFKQIFGASTTAAASLNIPSGTWPTSPITGDFGYDGTHLYFKTSGGLVDLLAAGGGGFSDPLTTDGDIIARISSSTTRLAKGANNTFLGINGSGVLGYYTPSGSGTVTATGGNLTSNAVVLGAGTIDTKVVVGITTNGTAQLILGVNTTTLGSIKFFGNTSGDVTIQPNAVAGTGIILTLPAITGTLVTGGGTASGTNTGDQTTISGNAGTATTLQTARTINGTSFNGSANITVTADATTLTGTTLNATVVSSSLTSVGTIGTGTWQGTLVAGQYGGTGVANTGKTITLGGNLVLSGAFATTFTVGAATNVTLPSTGTLATLAGVENLTNKTIILGINSKTANYTLALTDSSQGIEVDSAGSVNITIPNNATVAFPIGVTIPILIKNTGTTTIVLGGSVTGRPSAGTGILTSAGQNTIMYLLQRATDDWYILNGSPASGGGSGGVVIQNISSSTTITTAANTTYTVFIDATSGNVVVTLPTGSSTTSHIIRRIDSTSNTVTFSGTINGFGTSGTNLLAGSGFIMTNNGSNFYAN